MAVPHESYGIIATRAIHRRSKSFYCESENFNWFSRHTLLRRRGVDWSPNEVSNFKWSHRRLRSEVSSCCHVSNCPTTDARCHPRANRVVIFAFCCEVSKLLKNSFVNSFVWICGFVYGFVCTFLGNWKRNGESKFSDHLLSWALHWRVSSFEKLKCVCPLKRTDLHLERSPFSMFGATDFHGATVGTLWANLLGCFEISCGTESADWIHLISSCWLHSYPMLRQLLWKLGFIGEWSALRQ